MRDSDHQKELRQLDDEKGKREQDYVQKTRELESRHEGELR